MQKVRLLETNYLREMFKDGPMRGHPSATSSPPQGVCQAAHGRGKLCPGAGCLIPPGSAMYKGGSGPKPGRGSRAPRYLQMRKLVFHTLASIDGSSLLWTWRLSSVLASLLTLALGSHLSCINKHLTNDHLCPAP